jgi:hypothetical protein
MALTATALAATTGKQPKAQGPARPELVKRTSCSENSHVGIVVLYLPKKM